eukprot:g13350.t1
MPGFGGAAAGHEIEVKKRSTEEIASGITTALLILVVVFFTCGSLWLGIFAIPSFFAFFRASVVAISSIREGVNQLQASLPVLRPLSFRSLRMGVASGLMLTYLAGGLTIFAIALLRDYALSGDSEDAFTGVFRVIGAVVFTHLGVSILQQGSRTVRSGRYYQEMIKNIGQTTETANGPERSHMFYMGLGAAMREGIPSYIYMFPLGGAYEAKNLPLPAVLGAIAGLLAARYLAPALVWGGVAEGSNGGINPDSKAKSWAVRREALTNQYVSRLAEQAAGKGRAALESDGTADEMKDASGKSAGGPVTKNLSQLSAGALEELFKESNVDPANFDDMDYAQKRLLVLKSSKAIMRQGSSGSYEDDDNPEPAILALQNSSQWGSVSSGIGDGAMPDRNPTLVAGEPSGSGQRGLFHRRGQSLLSIAEDEDGYLDRGGYSYDGAQYPSHPVIPRGSHDSGRPPVHPGHRRQRSSMKSNNSNALGRATSGQSGASVRFQGFSEDYDSDDDTRSELQGFEHRYLRQAGARDPHAELEVMEATLKRSITAKKNNRNGSVRNMMHLRPGSPTHTAPVPPEEPEDVDESIGGNMALGSRSAKSRSRMSRSGRRGSTKSRRSFGGGSASGHSRRMGGAGGAATITEDEEEEDLEAGFGGRNAIPDDFAEKSFFATIALSISAFVIFLCCAGLLKLGVLDLKILWTDSKFDLFDICGCCEENEDGTIAQQFFAIFNSQFGYTCSETFTGLIAWVAYWVYPFIVMLFHMRMVCFSGIPVKEAIQMAEIPQRRAGAAQATGFTMKSTKRFLAGNYPDPARIKHHPTSFWIKLSALLNVGAGAAYIWWRAARSMPDDPASPVWNWLFFAGEVILTIGVWTSHLQRSFPSLRDVCTMDDLVEIDSNVANEATVCIMVPTAGEKMKNVKHVLLGAYSQRLWPSMVHANRQLRIAVLDEKGRREVCDLAEKVYRLAEILVNPKVQLELCTKFDEPYITPKIFMDYFNQMDALDKFVFQPESHPAFDIAIRMENYAGAATSKLARGSSSSGVGGGKAKKAAKALPRLAEGYKKLFSSSPNIPSMIYSARANPGTPKVSPNAGNMNAAIFPNAPGEEPVIGEGARIVVVNDARHRLKTEFLQRTVPYFFKLDRRTGKKYEWADVGFVQTPQRFEDLGDGDPLGNHAVLTFFVSNVSKDGVGGVTSCGQGSLWRVDALRGMAANGRQVVDTVAKPDLIGHKAGFRAEVLIEDTHTSLEFFKLQWRSAYVAEAGETLAVCVEQPNTVAWRVKQVFRWHIGAVQLLLKDGVGFLCTSKMPTPLHKMFGLDSLTYYIQAVGGFFIILMPIMFSIFQETPFNTVDLEFVYFFFPYIVTATIPTILAVGWKNVNPNRVLTDEQFWLSTCYVQIWAFALGVYNRITCANPDNAWNLVCPVWPLGLIFCLLIISAVNTTIYWAFYLEFDEDGIWIFLASFGACLVVMYSIWPMVRLWWPGWVSLPSAYHQKFCYILIFIALTSVLATYIDV